MLWQRFWRDLCTKQVVDARACAYQLLPCNSSGFKVFVKITVHADSCLDYEQIDTLFKLWGSGRGVGNQEGGLVIILGRRPKIYT